MFAKKLWRMAYGRGLISNPKYSVLELMAVLNYSCSCAQPKQAWMKTAKLACAHQGLSKSMQGNTKLR